MAARQAYAAECSTHTRVVCQESLVTPLILLTSDTGATEHLSAPRLGAMVAAIRGLETEVLALKHALSTRSESQGLAARMDRLEATLHTILSSLRAAPEDM